MDLGSGAGMDAFYAAGLVGPTGHIVGVDFTREQLDEARQLATEAIVCNADLWASCIGGAPQQDAYLDLIAEAGLAVAQTRSNPYEFLTNQARTASSTYGVKSVSLLAVKPADAW